MKRRKVSMEVEDYLWPELLDVGGSVFISSSLPRQGVNFGAFHDRTAAEALYNHVHVADLLGISMSSVANRKRAESFAVALALSWAERLSSQFPRRRFRVYITTDDEPIVRFHREWPGEVPWASAKLLGRVGAVSIVGQKPWA